VQHAHELDLHEDFKAVLVTNKCSECLFKMSNRLLLPGHGMAEQYFGERGTMHQRLNIALLNDTLGKAAYKFRLEYETVDAAGYAGYGTLELMQYVAVDKDCVARGDSVLRFAAEHAGFALRHQHDLQFLVPVPGNIAREVLAGILVVPRAGENGCAVLGELVQIGSDGKIEQLKRFHRMVILL
jgi:hypothetical protein